MAGEVSHVVYAARILTHLGDKITDPAYWAGTLFPDIRHLGVVSRHRTHPTDVSLSNLPGKDDFHTGMRVHAWIDATREKFLHDNHIKEQLPWHPYTPFCLNLFEDELLYSYFDDWNLITRVLNKQYAGETLYCADTNVLNRWHSLLQDYLKQSPTDESRQQLTRAIGLSENVAHETTNVINNLRRDGRAKTLLEKFWQHMEDLLR